LVSNEDGTEVNNNVMERMSNATESSSETSSQCSSTTDQQTDSQSQVYCSALTASGEFTGLKVFDSKKLQLD